VIATGEFIMQAVRANGPSPWTVGGFPFCQVVVEPAGRRVHLSGQVGWTPRGEIVGLDDAEIQTEYALDNIERVLPELSGSLKDVVTITMYYSRDEDVDAIQAVRGRRFNVSTAPASTGIAIAGFVDPQLLVELTATAVIPESQFRT